MNDHNYYRNNNDLKSEEKIIRQCVSDIVLHFKTDNGVFSKDYLDFATRILLENYQIEDNKELLDMGCGYGPIGIYYAKKNNAKCLMVDINERALNLAKENIELNGIAIDTLLSDGFSSVDSNLKFDYIISNPPIRAGKKVIYKMYHDAYEYLKLGGKYVIVIQKQHGAESTIKELKTIYSVVNICYKKKGFYIIESVR